MYKVSNTRAITRKQLFQRALLYAVPASIVIGILAGYINRLLPLEFEIIYIGVGYLIGEIVKETGHGIQIQFAVLAVVLTLLAYLIGDLLCYYGISVFFSSASTTFTLLLSCLIGIFTVNVVPLPDSL